MALDQYQCCGKDPPYPSPHAKLSVDGSTVSRLTQVFIRLLSSTYGRWKWPWYSSPVTAVWVYVRNGHAGSPENHGSQPSCSIEFHTAAPVPSPIRKKTLARLRSAGAGLAYLTSPLSMNPRSTYISHSSTWITCWPPLVAEYVPYALPWIWPLLLGHAPSKLDVGIPTPPAPYTLLPTTQGSSKALPSAFLKIVHLTACILQRRLTGREFLIVTYTLYGTSLLIRVEYIIHPFANNVLA